MQVTATSRRRHGLPAHTADSRLLLLVLAATVTCLITVLGCSTNGASEAISPIGQRERDWDDFDGDPCLMPNGDLLLADPSGIFRVTGANSTETLISADQGAYDVHHLSCSGDGLLLSWTNYVDRDTNTVFIKDLSSGAFGSTSIAADVPAVPAVGLIAGDPALFVYGRDGLVTYAWAENELRQAYVITGPYGRWYESMAASEDGAFAVASLPGSIDVYSLEERIFVGTLNYCCSDAGVAFQSTPMLATSANNQTVSLVDLETGSVSETVDFEMVEPSVSVVGEEAPTISVTGISPSARFVLAGVGSSGELGVFDRTTDTQSTIDLGDGPVARVTFGTSDDYVHVLLGASGDSSVIDVVLSLNAAS